MYQTASRVPHSCGFHSAFRVSKRQTFVTAKCLQGASIGTAAYSSIATAALTSPRHPLKKVFRPTNTETTRPSATAVSSPSPGIVLHTGYNNVSTAQSSPETNNSGVSPSFEVTDVVAFEQLVRDALHVTPVTLPQPDERAGSATSSSLSTSVENTTLEGATRTLLVNHTVRELQALLAETEKALETPASRKAEIDRYVYKCYLPLLKYGTFALLSLQFVVYFNWIFFVFDWNLVEPTTYFLGYTGVFCSLVYHYYRCGEGDFTWKNLFQHLANREAEKMYAEKKVNTEAVAQLQRRVAAIKEELARATV